MQSSKTIVEFLFFFSVVVKLGWHASLECAQQDFLVLPSREIASPEKASDCVWMNVFVHGIMSIQPHLSVRNFIRIINDAVEETVYIETVRFMRNNDLFYQNQAMQGFGLIPVDINHLVPGNASGAMANTLEGVRESWKYQAGSAQRYYTFGWSGIMSYKMRYRAAHELYVALVKEVERLKTQFKTVKVRLYGYSHGGNVVLNIGAVRQQEHNLPPLIIDQTLLFGMPVQSETDFLVNDPIFKEVYHFFSRKDYVQSLDFFSLKRFFSRQKFKNRRNFKLPDKLIQIEVVYKSPKIRSHRATKYNRGRSDRVWYDFENQKIHGEKLWLKDCSPGHIELWFFGWTPLNYRKSLPVYPFSTAMFAPIYLDIAQGFQDKPCDERPTRIELHPDGGAVVIKNRETGKLLFLEKFIPQATFSTLKDAALVCKPHDYTTTCYDQAICDAYDSASKTVQERLAQARQKRLQHIKSRRKKNRMTGAFKREEKREAKKNKSGRRIRHSATARRS